MNLDVTCILLCNKKVLQIYLFQVIYAQQNLIPIPLDITQCIKYFTSENISLLILQSHFISFFPVNIELILN